ncbi:MAG: flagellar biosynthetic protein FliO [Tepidanaerobacteraceae bacterium]|nr:flagellar biosynthetic protein FliO [Thermoanaerobacterales bacterium]
MRSNKIFIIVFAVLYVIFLAGLVFANPINMDEVNKYDFDVPDSNTRNDQKASNSIMALAAYILFFLIITFLAYYTTRLVGKHQMKLTLKSKYMQVIDSLPLGDERSLYIVKTPQGLLMIGITREGISLIDKLGAEETDLINEVEANQDTVNKGFANSLSNYLNKIKDFSGQNRLGG